MLLHSTRALASAKVCGMVHGMELQNFRRGCHLYTARRPSCLASAHILVKISIGLTFLVLAYLCCPGKKAVKRVLLLFHDKVLTTKAEAAQVMSLPSVIVGLIKKPSYMTLSEGLLSSALRNELQIVAGEGRENHV